MSIMSEVGVQNNEPAFDHELALPFDDDLDAAPAPKYPLFTSDHPDQPFELVHGDAGADTVWILVGSAQARAAAACEPEDVAVYCVDERNYNAPMRPEGLDAIEDKKVLIFPKGDAASSHFVFDRSTSFGRICADEGAAEVEFVWLGANLDDHLIGRDLEQRKKRLVRAANCTGKKPAKAKPAAPTPTQQKAASELAELKSSARKTGRPVIDVGRDRYAVINDLVDALKNGRDGDRIFNLGGKLAQLRVNEESGATEATHVDDKALLNLLPRCAQMISETTKGVTSAWPESKTLTALYGRFRDFRTLRGIAPSPIVRKDHTIATEDGYDEASQVLLDLDGLKLDIHDDPTDAEVAEAVRFLLDEWLGDFPFASQADRANVLAFILSYPLRELVDLVPLAVVSAKSKGTGKSKLVSLIVQLFTRAMPAWDSLPSNEEETRKQITTLLSTASPYIGFDESPVVGGKSINRLLTARMWSDRVLGGNERATLPNRSVIATTGNNVQVLGDTGRRYYPIELFYDGENPENRPESDFQHPDVEAWTVEHRGELLTAVFTLIRAWQVAGRPKKTTSFGSFERWEAVIGGVIANAGVPGFLANLAGHRESADYDEGLWVAHCEWLAQRFPGGTFTTSDVVENLTRRSGTLRLVDTHADPPPWVDGSPTDSGYAAKVGRLYSSRLDGWFGGHRLRMGPTKVNNKTVWIIEVSPRILQERAAAAAEAKAAAAAERMQQTIHDLPDLQTRLADLLAKHTGPTESLELKLARIEVENAQLLVAAHLPTDAA